MLTGLDPCPSSPGDDSERWLDAPCAARSINAGLARTGNAYPAYYTGLPVDLRSLVADLVAQARGASRGIWLRRAADVSTKAPRRTPGGLAEAVPPPRQLDRRRTPRALGIRRVAQGRERR